MPRFTEVIAVRSTRGRATTASFLLSLIALAPLAALALPASRAAAQSAVGGAGEAGEAGPAPMEQRLASEFMRAALDAASISPLTTPALDMACLLAQESLSLQPDSPSLWRVAMNIASLAERDDLRRQAIEALSRLDPSDDNIRLQRINLALEKYQTVEQRVDAYERLLQPDNAQKLGPAVASRLAFDFAVLKQRTGDTEAFSRWLTRALELDRSNRSAAALAAGFYQANVQDAVGRAELLVNLFLADPTDVQTQITLAQHLLENGAYTAAQRMYQLATSSMRAWRLPPTTELMADVAIAQWAAGDVDAALATISARQADIDEAYRMAQARTNRTLTMVQIGELAGPVDPTLATVTAVIHAERNDPEARTSLERAIAATEAQIATAATAATTPPPSPSSPADPAQLAAEHLQIALLSVWLGGDQSWQAKAAEHIAQAEALQPLSDQAKARFEGWTALNSNNPARAIEILTPMATDDTAARVGLAIALERAGRARDAASQLLELNTAQPGTMIGIWASSQLTRILGQRLPLSKQATELERLIASISRTFDLYPRDASMAIALRLSPVNPNPGPCDPLLVTIELTNTTSIPLAIDPAGPLRPQVLLVPAISTSAPVELTPKPIVVNLDSRLRLLPRETASATVDLRWSPVGGALSKVLSVGGIVKITMDTNFIASGDGAVVPGLFGVEVEAPLIRVNGAPADQNWLTESLALLGNPAAPQEQLMAAIALVSNELRGLVLAQPPDEQRKASLAQARTALPEAFARLEPARQAWTLMVMDRPAPVSPILDMARKSESRLVRMAYLLAHLDGPNDPMLDASRRGEDAGLRNLAEALAKTAAAAATAATAPATQ